MTQMYPPNAFQVQQPMQQAPQPQVPQDELSQLGVSIVRDQRRIGNQANVTPQSLQAEISGTILAYQRDIASYLQRFEQSVIANFNAVYSMIEDVQSSSGGGNDEGTQFDAEDAAKFLDFIKSAKAIAQVAMESAGTSHEAKGQLEKLLALGSELEEIVTANTLEDADDDEGDETAEESQP